MPVSADGLDRREACPEGTIDDQIHASLGAAGPAQLEHQPRGCSGWSLRLHPPGERPCMSACVRARRQLPLCPFLGRSLWARPGRTPPSWIETHRHEFDDARRPQTHCGRWSIGGWGAGGTPHRAGGTAADRGSTLVLPVLLVIIWRSGQAGPKRKPRSLPRSCAAGAFASNERNEEPHGNAQSQRRSTGANAPCP